MSFSKKITEIFWEYGELLVVMLFKAGLWPKIADTQSTVPPKKHPVVSVAKHCVTVVTEM